MKHFGSVFVLPLLLLLGACTAQQSVKLSGDGSGKATIRLEIKKLFAEVITSDEANGKLFDAARIKTALEKRPGVFVHRVATPTPETLEIELSFKDIRKIFGGGIINLTEKNGQTVFVFHLERNNAKRIAELFSDASNPAFKELSPRSKRTATEKEYLEAIDFAFGKEGTEALLASTFELRLEAAGTVVSQTGGVLENGAVVFRLPLLRMLMMEKPFENTVTFVPARKAAPTRPQTAKADR